jgi:HK97 family phage portal protein
VGIFLGQEKRSWIPEPPISPIPGANPWGQVNVTTKPDLALTLAPVWAAVGLLSNTISSLPVNTYRDVNGIPTKVANPPIVERPAGAQTTQSQWIHQVMVSELLRGNAIGRIVDLDGNFRPREMSMLNPDALNIDEDKDTGALKYEIKKTREIIPNDQIWHLAGMTMPGSKVGLGPISFAAATLGLELGARQFASDFFAGGGIPKAILKSQMDVNQAQATTLKERLMGAFRAREPIVLGNGVDYQQISVKPEESQFLLTQQATATDIARFFWIPADMIDAPSGKSMTYSNREQRSLDFLVYSVAHWLKRIEDGLSALLPGPLYVKFDVRQLLRTDVETQAKVHVQYLAGKVVAPSEVRADLGMPPMTQAQKDEADLVPLTITPKGEPKALPGQPEEPGTNVAPVPANDQQTQGGS